MTRRCIEDFRAPFAAESAPSDESDGLFGELLQSAAALDPIVLGPAAPLRAGSSLGAGRFQLLRTLGAGGMGVVYEAFDRERQERLALKILSRLSVDAVYRFKNEFRVVVDLNHPNLVPVYELFAEAGHWFYTMQRIDGVELQEYVRPGGVLDEARLRDGFSQLSVALRAIHGAGKLHRDLKPSNVLVTERGKVVVLDFGLSIDMEAGGVGQTTAGLVACGTVAYAAPEQMAGCSVSTASDLYAVGVMLFEALTARRPFEGSAAEIVAAKQRDTAPRASSLCHGLHPALDALAAKLLARDPLLRPSLREVQEHFASKAEVSAEGGEAVRLFGRSDELECLRSVYRSAKAGHTTLVTLTGASGVGKSALCEAFLAELNAEHALALAGRCYERESVPFNAFDAIIDDLSRRLRRLPHEHVEQLLSAEAGALACLFPVLFRVQAFARAVTPTVRDAQSLRLSAFATLFDLLAHLSEGKTLVLSVDDVQWADADSLLILERMLAVVLPVPVLIILSHRSTLAAPEPARLARVLERATDRSSLSIHRVAVQPLSTPAAVDLVAALLVDVPHVDDALVAQIAHSSEGSPIFAIELTRRARLGEHAARTTSFDEALAARLEGLPAACLTLLELLALTGQPLPARVALSATGATFVEVGRLAAERLIRIGLGSALFGSDKTLEPYHDRIRECVHARLSEEQRRSYSQRLFAALTQLDDANAELMCRCLVETGDLVQASHFAIRAAEHFTSALALHRAAELYKQALSWNALNEVERVDLQVRCAATFEMAGFCLESAQHYRAAAERSTGHEAAQLSQRAADQLLQSGRVPEGYALLASTCDAFGVHVPRGDVESAARLAFHRARMALRAPAPLLSERPLDYRLEMSSTLAKTLLVYQPSLQSMCALAGYLDMARTIGCRFHLILATGWTALTEVQLGTKARTDRLLADMDRLLGPEPALASRGFASSVHGMVHLLRNQPQTALPLLRAALADYNATPETVIGLYTARDMVRVYIQAILNHLGEFGEIARTVRGDIDDALRRGRFFSGIMLSGASAMPAWLVPDRPDAAEHHLAHLRGEFRPTPTTHFPNMQLLSAEMLIATYRGDPWRALELFAEHERTRARDSGAAAFRRMATVMHGLVAASALRQERKPSRQRAALRGSLSRALRSLRASPWQDTARILSVALALDDGDRERAVSMLRAHVEDADIRAGVRYAARSYRLGEWLGGDEGEILRERALAILHAEGVQNIDAMVESLVPGCRVN